MIVMQGRRRNHQAVRMESSGSNGGRPIAEESSIGLEVGYRLTVVDIEYLNSMSLCATEIVSFRHQEPMGSTYVANTGACS